MERPPSPHPNKLRTILENYEMNADDFNKRPSDLERVLKELITIKEEIKEIKDKLSE
jgi:hypothetical protein